MNLTNSSTSEDLIYRKHRPVHWSPSSVTALAEAELQYVDDHRSRSVYVTFDVSSADDMASGLRALADQHGINSVKFLIWTTTPWSIPANMVIILCNPASFVLTR